MLRAAALRVCVLSAAALVASCRSSNDGSTPPDGAADAGADAPGAGGDAGAPWYDTTLDTDTSYLPMGTTPYERVPITWTTDDGSTVAVDVWAPKAGRSPVVVFLPGAYIKKERYFWLANVLASHGVATALVQPPDAFSKTIFTSGTLAALVRENASATAALHDRLDVDRLVLSGHSIGALVQAALTSIPTCPAGFCSPGAATPPNLRGLLLLGFHNENPDGPPDPSPMPAVEAPWLSLTGSRDGLTTPAKASATFARLVDTPRWLVEIQGMNHYQFTDYVDPVTDTPLARDQTPTIVNKAARATAATYAVAFAKRVLLGDTTVPDDLGAAGDARVKATMKPARIKPPVGSVLPRVHATPFGDATFATADDTDVVATRDFQGATYLLVRNDAAGVEVWRIKGGAVERVAFPNGVGNGVYGNPAINGMLGAMEVFGGKLWFGFSSGIQGSKRASTGAELWTYDGTAWAPVVSRKVDVDPEVTVASCTPGTGSASTIALTGAAFTANEWAGGVADDVDVNQAAPTILDITSNTPTTLAVEDNELSTGVTVGACSALPAGAHLRLRRGADESGFGQPWNKAIDAMAAFDGKLFVATGFNYKDGAEVYVTTDGVKFDVAVPRAFFGKNADGSPRTSSVTGLHVSNVTGADALYIAATGTENYGARLATYPAGGPASFLVDDAVAGGTAFNKAGFGRGTFQIASLATFAGRLWIAGFDFTGMELFSVAHPAPPASDFRVEVGDGATLPRGWGDKMQIAANLTVVGGQLWVGDIANVSATPDLTDLTAAGLRTSDGKTWELVTSHAFGVNAVEVSRLFTQDGALFGVASRGSLSTHDGFGALRLYTLADESSLR